MKIVVPLCLCKSLVVVDLYIGTRKTPLAVLV